MLGDAEMNKCEWTVANTMKLINLYKENSELWDLTNSYYYKTAYKEKVWDKIACKMDLSKEACKRKMTILQAALRREKCKCKKDENYVTRWYCYKPMSFLLNRKRYETSKLKEVEEDEKVIEDSDVESLDEETEIGIDEFDTQRTVVKTPEQTDNEDNTELDAFMSFLRSKMVKYSTRTRSQVQEEICNIIFRAEKDHFRETDFETRQPKRALLKIESIEVDE